MTYRKLDLGLHYKYGWYTAMTWDGNHAVLFRDTACVAGDWIPVA